MAWYGRKEKQSILGGTRGFQSCLVPGSLPSFKPLYLLRVNGHWELSDCSVLEAILPRANALSVFQGIFIKDSNSLAYYNMANGAIIHLALKERGGRKK